MWLSVWPPVPWQRVVLHRHKMPIVLKVEGMSCGGCSGSVNTVVGKIEGVDSVVADHDANSVTIEGNPDMEVVKAAITKAGFEVIEE